MSTAPAEDLDPIHNSLVQFTTCVAAAVDDICSYGLTIGDSYVPFDPDPEDDCDEEDVACSQMWVRVESVVMANVTEGFGGEAPDGGTFRLVLEVGVLRCVDVPDKGEAPTASSVLAAALQAMSDMKAIQCAAMDCEVWESIESGMWQPLGPLGGQYGGTWTFTVELT